MAFHYLPVVNWTVRKAALDPFEITHRIIFNPNYGGPGTKVPGACAVPIGRAIKQETRAAIKESIRRDGFRNPIIVYRSGGEYLLSFGGGRLQAAKQLGIPVPALVVDYDGDMGDYEEVTEDTWQEHFTDVPKNFEWNAVGIQMHYGLERGRREDFDPAGVAWISTDADKEAVYRESPWLNGEEG